MKTFTLTQDQSSLVNNQTAAKILTTPKTGKEI